MGQRVIPSHTLKEMQKKKRKEKGNALLVTQVLPRRAYHIYIADRNAWSIMFDVHW
jgi:hypothetical protein